MELIAGVRGEYHHILSIEGIWHFTFNYAPRETKVEWVCFTLQIFQSEVHSVSPQEIHDERIDYGAFMGMILASSRIPFSNWNSVGKMG